MEIMQYVVKCIKFPRSLNILNEFLGTFAYMHSWEHRSLNG